MQHRRPPRAARLAAAGLLFLGTLTGAYSKKTSHDCPDATDGFGNTYEQHWDAKTQRCTSFDDVGHAVTGS
jgi:hypothetical protein